MAKYNSGTLTQALTSLSSYVGDDIGPVRDRISIQFTTSSLSGTPKVKFQHSLDGTNWDCVQDANSVDIEITLDAATKIVTIAYLMAPHFRVVGSVDGDGGTLTSVKTYFME